MHTGARGKKVADATRARRRDSEKGQLPVLMHTGARESSTVWFHAYINLGKERNYRWLI